MNLPDGPGGRQVGPRLTPRPRRFQLLRDVDESGVSGTGHIADGVLWTDGTAAVRWLGPYASTVIWSSLDHVVAVQGQEGTTRLAWLDQRGPTDEPAGLRDLPVEVRELVHAVDAARGGWADGEDAIHLELLQRVHKTNKAVWNRSDRTCTT